MQIRGTAYGVALNDAAEREALGDRLSDKPYGAPPLAPIVYIKPRNCVQSSGGQVALPAGEPQAVIGATVALHFAHALTNAGPADALHAIGAVSLAADVSLPEADYYRPAIAEKCRDGTLPIAAAVAVPADLAGVVIETWIDGSKAHEWPLSRLFRSAGDLAAELSGFMTLEAGDVLLIGIAGDAARAAPGAHIEVRAKGLPSLTFDLAVEALA